MKELNSLFDSSKSPTLSVSDQQIKLDLNLGSLNVIYNFHTPFYAFSLKGSFHFKANIIVCQIPLLDIKFCFNSKPTTNLELRHVPSRNPLNLLLSVGTIILIQCKSQRQKGLHSLEIKCLVFYACKTLIKKSDA